MQTEKQVFDYLIIGGGMVAGYAINAIREEDETSSIGVISSDHDNPYERPALSKKLWIDEDFTVDQIIITSPEESNTTFLYETKATAIDKEKQTVTTDAGQTIGYGKLLLATGGEAQTIEGPEDKRVLPFRTLEDYRTIREYSGENQHVIIAGGSYIGTELAANLKLNNTQITLVYPEDVLGEKRFPENLAKEYEQAYRDHEVQLLNKRKAERYEVNANQIDVYVNDGTVLHGDALILGIGITPSLSLAEEAGLDVEEGIVVDKYFRTSDPHIYAAGDIVSYPDAILGRRRIEHVDHARNSGTTVGKVMAGLDQLYEHTPYFYSNMFDIAWEAIGTLDPELELLIDEVDGGKVVYYLQEDQPVGILTWNIKADHDDIRQVLKNPPKHASELKGLIQANDKDK